MTIQELIKKYGSEEEVARRLISGTFETPWDEQDAMRVMNPITVTIIGLKMVFGRIEHLQTRIDGLFGRIDELDRRTAGQKVYGPGY